MVEDNRGFFEFIDHTADVGFRVSAPSLERLFEVAALALTEVITGVDSVAHRIERHIVLQEDDLEMLLVSWLQEILYLWDAEGLVFGRFRVRVENRRLTATAWGEPFDEARHVLQTEVKAVTYHQLEVVESDQGWQARVILDL
jgi:SHS2 domain-containing protein